jgi:hypothetical protein
MHINIFVREDRYRIIYYPIRYNTLAPHQYLFPNCLIP